MYGREDGGVDILTDGHTDGQTGGWADRWQKDN